MGVSGLLGRLPPKAPDRPHGNVVPERPERRFGSYRIDTRARGDLPAAGRGRAGDRAGRPPYISFPASFRKAFAMARGSSGCTPAREHLGGRAEEADRPLVEQGHAVGDRLGLLEHLRREDRGLAARARRADPAMQPLLSDGVHSSRERFVEDAQLDLGQERADQPDLLLHAERQFAQRLVHVRGHVHLLGEATDALEEGVARHVVDLREEAEEVIGGEGRAEDRLREQEGRAEADLESLAPAVEPEDRDVAGGGKDEAAEQVEQRGLAGAVRPDHAEGLAARDLEGRLRERDGPREALEQARRADGGRRGVGRGIGELHDEGAGPTVATAGPRIAAISSVTSMPGGHHVMQRPQPTQPLEPNCSCHESNLCVSHWR